MNTNRSPLRWHAISAAAAGLALLVNLALAPWVGTNFFAPFLIAVLLCSRYGGVGAGLTATALSFVACCVLLGMSLHLHLITLASFVIWLTTVSIIVILLVFLMVERRRIDEALQESEANYRAMFDLAGVGKAQADPATGRLLQVNRKMREITGYTAEELLNRTIRDITHPEDYKRDFDEYSRMVRGDTPEFVTEERYVRKDGRLVWVHVNATLIRDPEGKPLRTMAVIQDITERKRAEEQLRKLLWAIEQSPASVVITDPEGCIEYVNPKFTKLTGYTLQEARGKNPRILKSGKMPQEEYRRLWETIKAGGEWRGEFQNKKKNGELYWELASISPVLDDRGVITHFVAVKEDISDLKRSEEERERFFSLSLDLQGIAGFDGYLKRVNPAFQATLGLTPEELLARPFLEFIYPDDRAATLASVELLTTGRTQMDIELRCLCKDGSYRWIAWTAVPILEDEVFYMVGRDTTERRRAEQALEERARLAELGAEVGVALTRNIPLPVMLSQSAKCVVRHLDAAFVRIWMVGASGDTLELQASAGMYTHLDGPHSRVPFGSLKIGLIAQERRPHLTNSVIGDASVGDQEWAKREGMVAFAGYPLLVDDRLVGVIALFARRPLSDDTLQAMASISNGIALAIERRWAEQALAEAARAKDHFLAVLSHELRTPLTPVLMAVTAMLDGSKMCLSCRPTLAMIRNNVELEARLIEDLLDLSRIARGKMTYHFETADIHVLIRQAVEICRGDLLAKDHHLVLDLVASEHHVHADPARLEQVIWNLVANAVQYTPEGGRIVIRTQSDQGRLVVEVADNGIGIDPEFLPLLFDAFQRGEVANANHSGGLGLGLAISRSIIEAHSGTLIATNNDRGRGSTFTLELATITPPEDSLEPPAAPPAPTGRALRILLAEDNPGTAQVMADVLRKRAHEVTLATCLKRALEVASGEFDVVVSDIELGDGSGLELMRYIRASEGGHNTPGIALSGYATEEDVQQSLDAGFAVHLAKPVTFATLESAIHQVTTCALSSEACEGDIPISRRSLHKYG